MNDFHGDGKQGGGRSTPISKMSARDKCEVFGNYLDVAPKILGHVSHLGCRSILLCGELVTALSMRLSRGDIVGLPRPG